MTVVRPPNRRVSIAALPLRWRVATFLAFAAALNYADRAAMSAVLSAVRTDLGVSDVSLGLLGSVFLWSYAVGSPFAGSLADRYSRTRLVLGSLVAWSVVTALIGLVTTFPALLVLRFSLGVAECLFLPAAAAAGTGQDEGRQNEKKAEAIENGV